MKTQIDALHKFQNQLLSTFNAQELTYFKRSGWSGLLENIDRLYATMLHDWDVLQKDTDSIEKAVRSLDWSLVPYVKKGEKVSDQAQKVAQVVEDALWRRTPQKLGTYAHSFLQLLGAIVHAEFRGQNVHRIVWQNDGKLIYPAAFVQLPPQFLRWEVEPGKPDLLLHVPDGEMADPVPFKPYQFIVALNNAGPDHPLYNATYYGLVAWFSAAKNGLGWFMQYAEQHHLPKPVFHYDNDEDREQLIKDLQQDRVVNAILLYGDRQVEWANMPTGTTMPQKELLELAEAHCHKAILGQTLTSGTDKGSGSLAQAKVHAGVQADEVMKHAEFVAEVINRQLIPAIVHLNFGKVEGMPLPELRFKLPQAAANIERAQFWTQVMQIPGMAVVKSEVYDSLGIAMPGDDDEVLEAPGGAEQGLAALLGGGGDDTPPRGGRKPKKKPVDEDSKDEVALAAKARPTDPLRRALPEWVKPIREKILQARRDGASFEELQRMLREARPDTRALAAAFAENVEAGLRGDAEEVEAANPYGCNQYGEGWKLPHNGNQVLRRRKDAEPAPDTKALDDSRVDDDDDSPDAVSKRRERLNLHRSFAEEMKRLMAAWGSGQSEIVKAAAGTEDDKRPFPVRMPDGTMCYTYGCEKHKDADALALKEADRKLDELEAQIKQAYEKGQRTKVEKLMEEHEQWTNYAARCSDVLAMSANGSTKLYFEPAKTKAQAKRNTASLVGGDIKKVSWGNNISLDQMNEYNETMAEMMDKYPLDVDVNKLGSYTDKDDAYGAHCAIWANREQTDISLDIQINQDHEHGGIHSFEDWKPYTQKQIAERGFERYNVGASESGMSVRNAMIHEYGHALHARALMAVEHSDVLKKANWLDKHAEAGQRWERVYNMAKNSGDSKKISEYSEEDPGEFFAECFTARENGEKLPNYINSALDNIINLAIRKP